MAGRVALVTGADVAIHHLDQARAAETLASECRMMGRRTVTLAADFTDPTAARGVVRDADVALGRIVLVSSVNRWTPNPGLVAYAASKSGLMQMARVLALELAPDGVTVNLVGPGTIETDFNRAALADPAWRAGKLDLIAMRRIGAPEDVAAAVLFLAGPGAGYITGSTITVDGGLELLP